MTAAAAVPTVVAVRARRSGKRSGPGVTGSLRAMFPLELIGGGRMGEALLTGLFDAGTYQLDDVVVVEVDQARRDHLQRTFSGLAVSEVPVTAEGVIIATKPQGAADAVAAAVEAGCERVLSIAAGVRLEVLRHAAGASVPVVRAMPNTASLVGAGATAIAGGEGTGAEDLGWAERIMGSVGVVVTVPERSLDAVTGLSGSGPAYVFLIAEALIEAGVLNGLPRETAEALAVQTLLGSAQLMAESGDDPSRLRAAVTSPGGTTASGLRVLEQRAVRAAVIDAVTAAADRANELGS